MTNHSQTIIKNLAHLLLTLHRGSGGGILKTSLREEKRLVCLLMLFLLPPLLLLSNVWTIRTLYNSLNTYPILLDKVKKFIKELHLLGVGAVIGTLCQAVEQLSSICQLLLLLAVGLANLCKLIASHDVTLQLVAGLPNLCSVFNGVYLDHTA